MNLFKLSLVAVAIMGLSACSLDGDDGRDGVDGIDGVDGAAGADGADGAADAGGEGGRASVESARAMARPTAPMPGQRNDEAAMASASPVWPSSASSASHDPQCGGEAVGLAEEAMTLVTFEPKLETVLELMMAALYLDLPPLMDRCADVVAANFSELDAFGDLPPAVIRHVLARLDATDLLAAERILQQERRAAPAGAPAGSDQPASMFGGGGGSSSSSSSSSSSNATGGVGAAGWSTTHHGGSLPNVAEADVRSSPGGVDVSGLWMTLFSRMRFAESAAGNAVAAGGGGAAGAAGSQRNDAVGLHGRGGRHHGVDGGGDGAGVSQGSSLLSIALPDYAFASFAAAFSLTAHAESSTSIEVLPLSACPYCSYPEPAPTGATAPSGRRMLLWTPCGCPKRAGRELLALSPVAGWRACRVACLRRTLERETEQFVAGRDDPRALCAVFAVLGPALSHFTLRNSRLDGALFNALASSLSRELSPSFFFCLLPPSNALPDRLPRD